MLRALGIEPEEFSSTEYIFYMRLTENRRTIFRSFKLKATMTSG